MSEIPIPSVSEFLQASQRAKIQATERTNKARQHQYERECGEMFQQFKQALNVCMGDGTPLEFEYKSNLTGSSPQVASSLSLEQCPQMEPVRQAGYRVSKKPVWYYTPSSDPDSMNGQYFNCYRITASPNDTQSGSQNNGLQAIKRASHKVVAYL